MSSSNCCFLTCMQISQEAVKVVWYSNLFKNFPQFAVIHTVKGFTVISEAEVDIFLEFSCFFYDPIDVGNLISGSSTFPNPAWTSGSSWFTHCWSLALVVSNSLWSYGLSPTRLLCSWGFSRQEYWNGLPCPPPGDLPNTGIKPMYLTFPALAGRFFTTTTWEAKSIQLTGKIILGIWIFWLKSRNLVQSKKCFLWLLLPQ